MVWKPTKKRRRSGVTRKSAYARGYDREWNEYSKAYRFRNPLCVMCKARGFTQRSEVTDHITPHYGDMGLFWDAANHQPLCKRCHDSDKARVEASTPQRLVRRVWLEMLMRESTRGGGSNRLGDSG